MKTITYHMKHALPLITALAFFPINSVFADQSPDLDEPKVLEKILKEAVLQDSLPGLEPSFTPNSKTPYTGWIKCLYDNGKVEWLGHVKDDKLDGPLTMWHENGQKAGELTYKDGKMDGLVTTWHDNGQKVAKITFKKGQPEQWIEWDEEGKATILCKDGVMIKNPYPSPPAIPSPPRVKIQCN